MEWIELEERQPWREAQIPVTIVQVRGDRGMGQVVVMAMRYLGEGTCKPC